MAIGGTQLYNKDKQTINPISEANAIDCTASGKQSTVHQDIADLYKQISDLTGDDEAVSNIIIEVRYKRSKSKARKDVEDPDGWGMEFINPTSDYPYTWKRTRITYKGSDNSNTTYEIVASANAEVVETIYRAVSDNSQPQISYTDATTGKEDLHKYDNNIPEFWSLEPVSVSASAPNVFMAQRVKKDGEWGKYSIPAQYGRWAYDSNVVFRYQVTSNNQIPAVEKAEENPGELWLKTNTDTFKGFLWVINATEVNGQLQEYNNVVWNGPNLISIVL